MALLLIARTRGSLLGKGLVVTVVLEVVWASTFAVESAAGPLPPVVLHGAEAARALAWSALLLALLGTRVPPGMRRVGAVLVLANATASIVLDAAAAEARVALGLTSAILQLVCVEQLYRNSDAAERWAVKFICLAAGGMALYDLMMYSDAMLFATLRDDWWAGRGYANAILAPLVAVSAARVRDWNLRVRVSRSVVFHSATLLSCGVFMLALATVGYGVRHFGTAWAGVASILLLFVGVVTVIALLASAQLRARLRVLLAKHFFTYRFDYRSEWIRVTDLLSAPDTGDPLNERALRAIADLVDSPGGALWLLDDDGALRCTSPSRKGGAPCIERDAPLLRFLARTRWIVDIREWTHHRDRYGDLDVPQVFSTAPDAWLLVPLLLEDRLIGVVELRGPAAPARLDWEVRDVLKTVSRQIAGFIASRRALERLVEARQFDAFNRMSAFVVHDLKNLVAQLSLLMSNADRHRDNPEFQRDMFGTVENVLEHMRRLLLQLRAGGQPHDVPVRMRLVDVLEDVLRSKRFVSPRPQLEVCDATRGIEIVAHRDRIVRVIGHLVQNAVDATPPTGSVRIAIRAEGAAAFVEIADDGCGMSERFQQERLFRPFDSTKPHGMGIGVFESREYLREIGGSLAVASREGVGTTFTIAMPLGAVAPRLLEEA